MSSIEDANVGIWGRDITMTSCKEDSKDNQWCKTHEIKKKNYTQQIKPYILWKYFHMVPVFELKY